MSVCADLRLRLHVELVRGQQASAAFAEADAHAVRGAVAAQHDLVVVDEELSRRVAHLHRASALPGEL